MLYYRPVEGPVCTAGGFIALGEGHNARRFSLRGLDAGFSAPLFLTLQTAEGLLLFGEVRPLGCLSFLLLCPRPWRGRRHERVCVYVVTAAPEALESFYH